MLQCLYQITLLGILFCHVYAANQSTVRIDWGSCMRMHGTCMVIPCKYIIALQCLNDLRKKNIFSQRGVLRMRVINTNDIWSILESTSVTVDVLITSSSEISEEERRHRSIMETSLLL